MSRPPLELTIYPPKIPCSLWPECPIEFHEVDNWGTDKQFANAELAAEWHKQDNHCGQKLEGYAVAHNGEGLAAEEVEVERLRTLHRFATLPHYDQEQP